MIPRALRRLALRDARRSWARILLTLAVIALPVAAAVLATSATTLPQSSRERALASLPTSAEASIVATAESPGAVMEQDPEGPRAWIDDADVTPASPEQITQILGQDARLHEWWTSSLLLTARDLPVAPGDTAPATDLVPSSGIDAAQLQSLTLREADAETLPRLMPALREGALPTDEAGIVLTTAAAERLGVGVGDSIQLLSPPSTGWASTEGAIADATQGTARGYRVDGIAPGDGLQGWALPSWIAPAQQSHPQGIPRRFLVDGATVTWGQVRQLNALHVAATSRHVLEDYPPDSALYPVRTDPRLVALQAGLIAISGTIALALVLLLVAPAFLIGAQRQRRSTALAVAAGALPGQMSRMILLQGALTGLLGSLIGLGAGLLALPVLRTALPALAGKTMGSVPPWILVLLVLGGLILGILGSAPAAREVSRVDTIQALTGRRPVADRGNDGGSRGPRSLVATVLALGAAILAGALGMTVGGAAGSPLLGLCMLALIAAAIASVPLLLRLVDRAARPAPALLRAAVRDARRHGLRTVPAVGVILMCALVIAASAIATSSIDAAARRADVSVVAPDHAALGLQTPVSDPVDQALTASIVSHLRADRLVTGSHPVWTTLQDTPFLESEHAPGKACGAGEAPSLTAGNDPSAPMECVTDVDGYIAGQGSFPSWLTDRVLIMDPAALIATGMPGAEQAARVIARGGVGVSDATALREDGTASILTREWTLDGEESTLATTVLPAAHLRGFGAMVVISPETARTLGLTTRYAGEILDVAPGVHGSDMLRLQDGALAVTSIAWPNVASSTTSLQSLAALLGGSVTPAGGTAALIGIGPGVLCLVAMILCLALGRADATRDLTTMHAIGATPRQLRLLGVLQALVILACGLVPGLAVGAAAGLLAALWMSRSTGVTGPPIVQVDAALPALVLAGVVLATLLAALWIARPPRGSVPRRE